MKARKGMEEAKLKEEIATHKKTTYHNHSSIVCDDTHNGCG